MYYIRITLRYKRNSIYIIYHMIDLVIYNRTLLEYKFENTYNYIL